MARPVVVGGAAREGYYLQLKFAASFVSPLPLYAAIFGYGHNGRADRRRR